MKFVKLIENDIVDSDSGISVSLWYFYCPHKCKGCHNSELWSIDYMEETPTEEVIEKLKIAINKNGVMRNLSILGGEPLAEPNRHDTKIVIEELRKTYPTLYIYLWTGYTIEELKELNNEDINYILKNVNTLIDGRFILEKRDITLNLRGSSNQRIFRNIGGKLIEEL